MSERVLDRVMDLADQMRDQAAQAEQIGRLTDDTVKMMKSAGLIRLLQTKQYQGFEVHPREFAETTMATAATGSGRRLDRRRCGRASLPAGLRRPQGLRGDLGRRRRHLDGIALRTARCGQAGRRWLHLQRPLAVQLGHRPLRLDHPGRDARRRKRHTADAAADAAHDPAAEGLRDRRGLVERGGTARNRFQRRHRQRRLRTDVSDDGRHEGDGWHRTARGGHDRAVVPDAVVDDVPARHLGGDHRHRGRGARSAPGLPAGSASAPPERRSKTTHT